jgi:hypothetical protein
MGEEKSPGDQVTEKEFLRFEEASTYAKNLAKQLCSSISVHRIETGWVVRHQCSGDQSLNPTSTIGPNPIKLPEKLEKSIEVYKKGNWWFVEGSEGRFSTEEQAKKAADVIRRWQQGKTTVLPANVTDKATKQSVHSSENKFPKDDEVSSYSRKKVARKPRKPKKPPYQKATKAPDRFIPSNPTQNQRANPIPKGSEDYLCIDCGELIPLARVEAIPNVQRCVNCQRLFEKKDSSITTRRIDEGLAGSRDDHKKMRSRQWGDMIRRHRE